MLSLIPFAHGQTVDEASKMIDAVKAVDGASAVVLETGTIKSECPLCKFETPKKSYELNSNKIELETPYYIKNNDPYIIHLKRNANSPAKITLKFKNGRKVCGKVVAYTLPINGAFEFGCLFYMTQYEEEEFDLNFKNLPPLAKNEEQVLEIRLSKSNVEKSDYQVDLNSLTGNPVKVEKDKKFWGDGINFKFTEIKKIE
jgi:hypothetical protein